MVTELQHLPVPVSGECPFEAGDTETFSHPGQRVGERGADQSLYGLEPTLYRSRLSGDLLQIWWHSMERGHNVPVLPQGSRAPELTGRV